MAIGSHDLVLDVAASALRAADPIATLASSNVGSLGGLVALRDGLCHLAESHLLDPVTGEYTLPYVDRLLSDGPEIVLIRLVHRDQGGLVVAPSNPAGLSGVDDLTRPGLRYVNRQRGAGTQALLDHELTRRGLDPTEISGYSREEHAHLAAAAVAAGRADTGMGILAAARAFGLDFVPVAREPLRPGPARRCAARRPARTAVGAARAPGLPGRRREAGRLLLRGDRTPDPLTNWFPAGLPSSALEAIA